MAMSEEDKKETKQLMAEAFAEGLALFRSKSEEEAAKNPPKEEPEKKGSENDGGRFTLSGFLLGN
jgi:hypothetical protein